MENLRGMRADSADALLELMEGFRPGASRTELLASLDSITLNLHIIAVATLLVDGEVQKFHSNLCRMAENARRIHLLMTHRGLALPPASWSSPLLAALAAGQFPLASALAAASRDSRANEDDEYEDEFLWGFLLQKLARLAPPPAAEVDQLLGQIARVDPEPYLERAEVVRALVARDAEGFVTAILAAHGRYAEEIEEKKGLMPPTRFSPHRSLWLEGLAFLRLADNAGIPSANLGLTYCPPLARLPMTEIYDGDWAVETGLPN